MQRKGVSWQTLKVKASVWPSSLAWRRGSAALVLEFFRSSLSASSLNKASLENRCGTRAILSRTPACHSLMSPALQPPVNAFADLDLVALPIVREAPYRSSPD